MTGMKNLYFLFLDDNNCNYIHPQNFNYVEIEPKLTVLLSENKDEKEKKLHAH